MTGFGDQLMIRYLDPAGVGALLMPPSDPDRQRVRALLASVYQPDTLAVEEIDEVTVTAARFQVPVVEPARADGVLDELTGSGGRTQLSVTLPPSADPLWQDLVIDAVVRVKVSSSAALLDGVTPEAVAGLSESQFVGRFDFVDLPTLLAANGVSTYAQLQARSPQLFKLHYADPPAYDPADPDVVRTYRLRIGVLFFPTLELTDALRRFGRTRQALDAANPQQSAYEGGNVLGSSAWLAVFPTTVIGAGTPTKAQIEALFGADHIVAAFETV